MNRLMLNNGLKQDIVVTMKGLEEFTFDECFTMAKIADFEGSISSY
jgi:hypothetical protein